MKKKQEVLLQYLSAHQDYVTALELSKALGVSIRTVKSYIADLHQDFPLLISSTNRGYQLQRNPSTEIMQGKRDDIPQDYEERCIYIIKKLLLEKNNCLDAYDVCDELFISISTLKNDLNKMNTSFASFSITFLCMSNQISIQGSEKNKRRLISHVMNEEASGNFIDLLFLEESFPTYHLDALSQLLKETFQLHHYYVNDFALLNLILHIVIMVDRIHQGNHIHQGTIEEIDPQDDAALILDLCNRLEVFFDITFTPFERFEIYILCKTNINQHSKEQMHPLQKIVSEDILCISKNIAESVDEHFFINLMSESFMTPFSLHVKNLKSRLEYHSDVKNPMIENIKNSCPTIYDIATFIAYQLMQEFHEVISEDEIAFIALHVGTEIERQKSERIKVRCILLAPNYLNIHELMYNQLLLDFGEQIMIVKTLSYEADLEGETFDLLLTTVPCKESSAYPSVLLSPFASTYDKKKLMDAIKQVQNNLKGQDLKDNIDTYFNENLFFLQQNLKHKYDIIKLMSHNMISLNYVNEQFENEVIKRESASSTAFMKVAIPHPMKMGAYKTSIAVYIDADGIEWDKNHVVNIVCMIAFNRIDNKKFHELYESLIMLFNENSFIYELRKCKSYEDFKQILVKNYIKYAKQ